MKKTKFSKEHLEFLKKIKRNAALVWSGRIITLVLFLAIWELLADLGIIDTFITSSPSKICITIFNLFIEDNLIYHIGVTLLETVLGFIIAAVSGMIISILLWLSESARKIAEPYIVVLNSLPKIALGPIIIVWFGSGMKSIVFMAVIIGIIVSVITMLNGFIATDKDKILLLKSMGANKIQILTKLVIPGSMPTLFSMLKLNIGMAWIGSIMGEYLVSRAGLGYLIVYGGQVFKLDLVMAATLILCLLATIMYVLISLLEKIFIKHV